MQTSKQESYEQIPAVTERKIILGKTGHDHSLFFPLVTAIFITLTFLSFPTQPFAFGDSLAEKATLSYAHQHGWQFGTDLVFTYGPLAFLTSRFFFEHAAALRTVTEVLVCFTVASGLCLLAWQLSRFVRAVLLSLFVFVLANVDPRGDLVLYLGLLVWGLLVLRQSSSRFTSATLMFILFAAYAALVKVNFLTIASASALSLAFHSLLSRRPLTAVALTLGFLASFLLGWIITGQNLQHLFPFLRNLASIVPGYDQAMANPGLPSLRYGGLLSLVLAIPAVLIRVIYSESPSDRVDHSSARNNSADASEHGAIADKARPAEIRQIRQPRATPDLPVVFLFSKALLAFWLVFLLFAIWKHGFVRADPDHVGYFLGFAPILVSFLEVLPCRPAGARLGSRGFALACVLVAVGAHQLLFVPSLKSSFKQPFTGATHNIWILLHPRSYRREMLHEQEAPRREAALPRLSEQVGAATVDVFGQNQLYALFNGLNFHPRPIFQSFVAYNSWLMRLNEQFYLSKAQPEYVIFELRPIDRKFPPLEDSLVLRHLLINYKLIDAERSVLLLKSVSAEPARLTLLQEGIVQPRGHISLKPFGNTNLWLEIRIQPRFAGRVRSLFYKAPKLRLAAWGEGNKPLLARGGAPAPMLAAGFVASPLLLNNDAVADLYEGKSVLRPSAYSVEPEAGTDSLWQQTIHYRIYQIENHLASLKSNN